MAPTPAKELRLSASTLRIAGLLLLLFAKSTRAQDVIRVETNQVLVPVMVIDRERKRLFDADPRKINQALLDGDAQLADHILENIVVRGLTAADFQIFEDGKAQEIQSATYQRGLYWNLRDNQGHHTEFAGPGGGKWSTAEWPPGTTGDMLSPYYVVSYSPPKSPEGRCHQIKVKVPRPNMFVAAPGSPIAGNKLTLPGARLWKYLLAIPEN
jgi:hypothetical protein